ncbi:L-fuculose-phosphate aldolase [Desulfonispora thiosulfatigenes DSM 11270]|uniref:L-fuculose-phosphate aldolase n=1 Tax=Desulfonispora thiosulfatigenes DSM 11270 TaxID=656914 RepID=A0A1W1VJZ0_DESTI|nr:class II aldolase/adducin family protein [Desulfonispora thiosulfatigenes]SMB93682.1 L-fuculose-phosphate aldolase [Desulfonispora thiosulfatigenes DSM 11270]
MEIKKQIVEVGKRMVKLGLVASTWGNISAKINEKIYITPSGMEYEHLTEEDIVCLDLDGNLKEGQRKPSSELNLHIEVYKNRPEITGIVHTHSLYASAYAVVRKPILPYIEDMAQVVGGEVLVADYALPGTKELAQNAVKSLGNKGAVLLANHGVVGVGIDLEEAFKACLLVEKTAQIAAIASNIGTPHSLEDKDVELMREGYLKYYGQKF